jgi:hypothetical protein
MTDNGSCLERDQRQCPREWYGRRKEKGGSLLVGDDDPAI